MLLVRVCEACCHLPQVLGDIELAQGLEREREMKQTVSLSLLHFLHEVMMMSLQVGGEIPHPLDSNYETLKARLTHIKKEEEEYEVVDKYIDATGPTCGKVQLLDLFRVDREGEVRSHSLQ